MHCLIFHWILMRYKHEWKLLVYHLVINPVHMDRSMHQKVLIFGESPTSHYVYCILVAKICLWKFHDCDQFNGESFFVLFSAEFEISRIGASLQLIFSIVSFTILRSFFESWNINAKRSIMSLAKVVEYWNMISHELKTYDDLLS